MFNFRPTIGLPGFRVGVAEGDPGFRINRDGSVGSTLPSASNVAVFGDDPYGNALQITPPAAFNPLGLFSTAGAGLYPTSYRPYDPVAARQPSQDSLPEQSDPTATLYAGVGGNPFDLFDQQSLGANAFTPVGDGLPPPYLAYGERTNSGMGSAPTLRPDLLQASGMEPSALASSRPPSSPPPSMMIGQAASHPKQCRARHSRARWRPTKEWNGRPLRLSTRRIRLQRQGSRRSVD